MTETSNSKKLSKVMSQITTLHIESRKKQTFEKKLENYTCCVQLINEATKLMDDMQNQISKLDTSNVDKSHLGKINGYIDLLTNNALNFDEIIYIIEQLIAISNNLPMTTQIYDNIEQEIIYEEQEISQEI